MLILPKPNRIQKPKKYMEKPVDVEKLLKTVKNMLGDGHIANYRRVT